MGDFCLQGAECCLALWKMKFRELRQTFMEKMNAKARICGMKNTHPFRGAGLHDPEHYSTAYDIALLLSMRFT